MKRRTRGVRRKASCPDGSAGKPLQQVATCAKERTLLESRAAPSPPLPRRTGRRGRRVLPDGNRQATAGESRAPAGRAAKGVSLGRRRTAGAGRDGGPDRRSPPGGTAGAGRLPADQEEAVGQPPRGRRPAPSPSRSADLDVDPPRLGVLGLGNAQLQHALCQLGGHLFGVQFLAERENAAKPAQADFGMAGFQVIRHAQA